MKIICKHKELLKNFHLYSGLKPYENQVVSACPTCGKEFSISIGEYAGSRHTSPEDGFITLKRHILCNPEPMEGLELLQ